MGDLRIRHNRRKNISAVPQAIAENKYVADKLQNPVVRVERRRARRYPFVASVELVDLQSDLQLQARVTDLSLYGCGVAASKPIPTGNKLRIRITRKGSTFSASSKVVYARADGDMGIVFGRMEPNDQMILEKWISELPDR
jgi:PilZ domain